MQSNHKIVHFLNFASVEITKTPLFFCWNYRFTQSVILHFSLSDAFLQVYAPKKLLLPVLPVTIRDKLQFVLCSACAENNNQSQPCSHTEEERALTGTFTTPELYKYVGAVQYIVPHVDDDDVMCVCTETV